MIIEKLAEEDVRELYGMESEKEVERGGKKMRKNEKGRERKSYIWYTKKIPNENTENRNFLNFNFRFTLFPVLSVSIWVCVSVLTSFQATNINNISSKLNIVVGIL